MSKHITRETISHRIMQLADHLESLSYSVDQTSYIDRRIMRQSLETIMIDIPVATASCDAAGISDEQVPAPMEGATCSRVALLYVAADALDEAWTSITTTGVERAKSALCAAATALRGSMSNVTPLNCRRHLSLIEATAAARAN